jgi:hypothetical protein
MEHTNTTLKRINAHTETSRQTLLQLLRFLAAMQRLLFSRYFSFLLLSLLSDSLQTFRFARHLVPALSPLLSRLTSDSHTHFVSI